MHTYPSRIGGVKTWSQIPELTPRSLVLSSEVLGTKRAEADWNKIRYVDNGSSLGPPAHRLREVSSYDKLVYSHRLSLLTSSRGERISSHALISQWVGGIHSQHISTFFQVSVGPDLGNLLMINTSSDKTSCFISYTIDFIATHNTKMGFLPICKGYAQRSKDHNTFGI